MEKIIVSLTTWSARIGNLPAVLDTIFAQSFRPDKVILNLAQEEVIPEEVKRYIEMQGIEVLRTEDTKVHKKLIPTLRRYPEDCIISIDDDLLYPPTMIEDFVNIHKKYPHNPISGNRLTTFGLVNHNGCASLTKAVHFGEYLNLYDDDLIANCPCDDIAYTFLTAKNGFRYIWTENRYYIDTLKEYNDCESYSLNQVQDDSAKNTFNYLCRRFGSLEAPKSEEFINDKFLSEIIDAHFLSYANDHVATEAREKIKSTTAYKIGKIILSPIKKFKI